MPQARVAMGGKRSRFDFVKVRPMTSRFACFFLCPMPDAAPPPPVAVHQDAVEYDGIVAWSAAQVEYVPEAQRARVRVIPPGLPWYEPAPQVAQAQRVLARGTGSA